MRYLLNLELKVEVCDATDDAKSTTAGYIIQLSIKELFVTLEGTISVISQLAHWLIGTLSNQHIG